MTNLMVGGEDIEYGMISAVVNTGGGGVRFDPDYARCSLRPTADVGIIHDFNDYPELVAALLADNAFWYGYRWRGGGGGFTFGNNIITFYKGDIAFFQVCQRGGAGECGTRTYDGLVWTEYPGSIIAQSGSHTEHTFRIRVGNPGWIRWYIAGVLWWAFEGNTAALGGGSAPMNKTVRGAANANGDSDFSELMVTSDDDSRLGKRLKTHAPIADGDHTDWDSGFGEIDEVTEATADAISTNTAGDKSNFVLEDLPPEIPGTIPQGIIISAKVQSQVGAPQNVKGLITTGGVDFESAQKLANPVPKIRQFSFPLNPSTGLPWTRAEVNALKAGLTAAA